MLDKGLRAMFDEGLEISFFFSKWGSSLENFGLEG
jgi:hypothetical protein